MRIGKSLDWLNFERLFSCRRIKLFKTDTRTCVHVEVEGTGKRFVFIAKENGDFSTISRTIGIQMHTKAHQYVFMTGIKLGGEGDYPPPLRTIMSTSVLSCFIRSLSSASNLD